VPLADGSLETFRTKGVTPLISNRQLACLSEKMEARGGIEPPIKVLQSYVDSLKKPETLELTEEPR
jgi:hypothetical protein